VTASVRLELRDASPPGPVTIASICGFGWNSSQFKMMPATVGGPGTNITFGPRDHRGYKGDLLLMKQLRNGRFDFAAYHRPQWPTNGAEAGGAT
jgi:hypothetical protein